MFNISDVGRRLVNHTITSEELAVDDQEWMDLLQCIKGQKDPLGDNPNAERFQLLLLDLSRAFLTLLSKGTVWHICSDIARVVDFLEGLVSRLLEVDPLSWTATQEHCFSLLSFILWVTYSRDIFLGESPNHRELILNVLERFTLSPATSSALKVKRADNQYTDRPNISLNDGRRFTIKPPSLHVVAQLCTAIRYKCIAMLARGTESERLHDVPIRSYDFNDDWKRSVLPDPSRAANGHHWPNNRHAIISGYTSGTFQGLWEGAFFTPFIIKWESPDMSQESDICTCEMAMRYQIREYHSFHIEDTVCWTEEEDGGISQARAWFPERMEWYESLVSLGLSRVEGLSREDNPKWGLSVFDSTKDRWLRYHPFSASRDGGQVVDTIIVGIASKSIRSNSPLSRAIQSIPIPGSKHGEYKVHGRVRREDGLVALVRQPMLTSSDYLGTWLFEGHVVGGREFVGDWRVTSRAAYSPGEQGWFTLTKACEESMRSGAEEAYAL